MSNIKTTCPYCGVGCGINAVITGDRKVEIKGDDAHPANFGRLCSKGTHVGETVGMDGRLLHPKLRQNNGQNNFDKQDDWQDIGWDAALCLMGEKFGQAIEKYGPDSVAFYVSGQILIEDYYLANKLMKGFIGSSNIDTNSRLCMASAVVAHNRAFGEDVVPVSYDDLEAAELIILVGSNTAWCHPVIWQRIEAARAKNGAKLVVIDPRRTETADCADLHIPICADGDAALFGALLYQMQQRGIINNEYLDNNVNTPDGFWDNLDGDISACDIDPDDFAKLTDMVAQYPKMVTLFSMGINQSKIGVDKGNAIINLHLAMGRIGQAGMGPFSMTGQPNAMGGREVGGLASTLAVHMGFSPEECKDAQDFWQSPTIATAPGLKAVDMFRAVHDGRIKALWVMGTNPAMSMPDSSFVREALAKCEFLVVSDCIEHTDTAQYAHVKLPALAWGEKAGMVTNSERVMSRQRALFPPPGQAKADWWAMAQLGIALGHEGAFSYDNAAQIFREYAAQTAFRNDGKRKLNLGQWAGISDIEYENWHPTKWGGASPFADGKYTHKDGKARLINIDIAASVAANPDYPLSLNTGRYRDQWHSMTRTGLSPTLSRHRAEPLVEIHGDDAKKYRLSDGDLARISTESGAAIFKVQVNDAQRKGDIFVPMHWTEQMGKGGLANMLPAQLFDPLSHQPAYKNSPAKIEKINRTWQAFLISREKPDMGTFIYAISSRIKGGWLTEISSDAPINIDQIMPQENRIEAVDHHNGSRRVAIIDEAGRLQSAIFISSCGFLPPRVWIAEQLENDDLADSMEILAARPRVKGPDKGAIICVCYNIGEKEITNGVVNHQWNNLDLIGQNLRAGTNCGSCRPAITKIISNYG
ncbi:nitrate reductase [Sphingorhabdus lutea]|uniref:Nitrate reductase n=1 Tax=Sphingorhabdus lutea TaxID=1913578 RepID=A0A1L3J8V6_9SPHN|nr:nitrate reductase [Sphingorhabdus lutea]APG61569.1 nitrate reductase [Sphingorhabdus lutea]